MVSEVSQTDKDIYHMISFNCGINYQYKQKTKADSKYGEKNWCFLEGWGCIGKIGERN